MRALSCFVVVLAGLCLAACQSVAPNRLSLSETADLRFVTLDVRVAPTARVDWSEAEDTYLKGRGLSMTDPALVRTPDARADVNAQAARRVKASLERALAKRPEGGRPVRLVATITAVNIPSVTQRILIGGTPSVAADIDVVDPRTGAVLTTYRDAVGVQSAGGGLNGVVIEAALIAVGRDDLFDRASNEYANGFADWLRAGP